MPVQITVTQTLTLEDEFLTDILINTVESGSIGYWAYITDVERDEDLNVLSFKLLDMEEANEAVANGVTTFDVENSDMVKTIDAQAIASGIGGLLNGKVKVGDYLLGYLKSGVYSNDAGDIDADVCDAIVQAHVFGELVYG